MGDDPLLELLAVNYHETFNFFSKGVRRSLIYNDRSAVRERIPRLKVNVPFIASILADLAQTSCSSQSGVPTSKDLTAVFDDYIFTDHSILSQDKELLLSVAAHTLLLGGFLREQTKRRHNVRWFVEFGQGCFYQASKISETLPERELFEKISCDLALWADVLSDLSKYLREQPMIIDLSK